MPAIMFLSVTSLLCFLMAIMPSLTFLLAIVWGSVLVLSALLLQRWQIIIIFLINNGLLYSINGNASLFFYLAFFGMAALVMTLMITFRRDYYETQKWGIITAVLGVSIFMGAVYLDSGQIGIQELEKQINNYLQDTLDAYEDSGIMDVYEEQGSSKAEVMQSFADMAGTISKHLPAIYYLQAIVVIFLMLLGASWLSLKFKLERLKKRPYSQEIMPWQFAWVTIAGLSLWLWGREEMGLIYYIGSNILVVMVPISIYFGIAALVFKIKQQSAGKKKWITTGLVVLSVVFPLSAVIFFGLIGLFDALLDFRKMGLE